MSQNFSTTQGQRPSDLVRDELPEVELPDASAGAAARAVPSEDDVLEAMRDVVDPELMINVVDLGLVYGVTVDEDANVAIDMTLTTPTCPLTDQLEYQTQMAMDPIANSVVINWVWLPPWDLSRITDDGREQLRAVGFAI